LEALLAGAGLLVLFPFLAVIAIVVKLQDSGPIFYRAKRVGKAEKLFDLFKFRTMVPDADTMGPGITPLGDGRVTPVGRILRRYKLDEFPQLINVLKGDMSFVGARPEDPRYVEHYSPNEKEILKFRPGMTSPASLEYRDEESLLHGSNWHERYVNVVLPRKLIMDLSYLKRRTFSTDMTIILRTLGRIVGV
jgi:lipopolysaccharide/colanic/teichoic acid biosynthesis glycosyltransferase